ncbi:MAG: hypothetical protein J6Y29_00405 [Clostridiales bacterium]|nr:hypothetical protein [Clostridiales bacterium]
MANKKDFNAFDDSSWANLEKELNAEENKNHQLQEKSKNSNKDIESTTDWANSVFDNDFWSEQKPKAKKNLDSAEMKPKTNIKNDPYIKHIRNLKKNMAADADARKLQSIRLRELLSTKENAIDTIRYDRALLSTVEFTYNNIDDIDSLNHTELKNLHALCQEFGFKIKPEVYSKTIDSVLNTPPFENFVDANSKTNSIQNIIQNVENTKDVLESNKIISRSESFDDDATLFYPDSTEPLIESVKVKKIPKKTFSFKTSFEKLKNMKLKKISFTKLYKGFNKVKNKYFSKNIFKKKTNQKNKTKGPYIQL